LRDTLFNMKRYDTIIVGAGAAGLYCANFLEGGKNLILEKGKRPGLKLLMAGSGQCNVTHGGSIKDFLTHYGDHGKKIRGVLQRHNNVELCRFLAEKGVPVHEREDGKVFPQSMKGQDVLDALLEGIGCEIHYGCNVLGINVLHADETNCQQGMPNEAEANCGGYLLETTAGQYHCKNLVVAAGGASYPTTGSDGVLTKTLGDELGLTIEDLRPALTPVFVENYIYGELSGMSFKDVEIRAAGHSMVDDILFTFKNLSGPAIINSSRYMKTGDTLTINFMWPMRPEELVAKLKKDFPGNAKSPQNYMIDELGLQKRFAKLVSDSLGLDGKKVSQLSGQEIKMLAAELTEKRFSISGLAGFKEAMATAGGVSLEEISTKTMEAKRFPGLYFVGEVLDVDGDTGGYNLQFAYSSARAAAEHINTKKTL